MKLYDKGNKRLLVLRERATSKFWDRQWDAEDLKKEIEGGKKASFVKKITAKFLQPGAKILEGGCGRGQFVYGLEQWGFDAFGVDFAGETVKKINKILPDLKIYFQDVQNLDFADGFFAGYWSVGVIEHFWEGYAKTIKEAGRVIKSNGYLFLTFPYMSPLRRLKARLNLYRDFEDKEDTSNFYQFILDRKKVKKEVENCGFKMVFSKSFDAANGMRDEVFFLEPVMSIICDSRNIFAKAARFFISFVFSGVAGHSILLVFKKIN